MKRLLIAFMLLFSFLNVDAQTYKTQSLYYEQSQPTVYINWQLTNQGCYGCASFYWMVNKTYVPETAQYRFDIWFYSNSFYANGGWASTYLQGLYFNVDGYYLYNDPSWLLFREKFSSTLTSFYTVNPAPVIKMTWASMRVY